MSATRVHNACEVAAAVLATILCGCTSAPTGGGSTAAATSAPASAAAAPTVYGKLGSPSATMSLDGKKLPAPNLEFGDKITHDALASTPWWEPSLVPPKGARNALLIITDDSGFGVPSTFGGVIPTPALDAGDHARRYEKTGPAEAGPVQFGKSVRDGSRC